MSARGRVYEHTLGVGMDTSAVTPFAFLLLRMQLLSEVWVTIWSMLAGASCYAGIIGSISAMMLNMDASGSRYLSRLDEMTQYMRDSDLPAALRDRVRGYFEQRWQQRKMFSEEELLALLPTSLEKVRMVGCLHLHARAWRIRDAIACSTVTVCVCDGVCYCGCDCGCDCDCDCVCDCGCGCGCISECAAGDSHVQLRFRVGEGAAAARRGQGLP